MISERTKQLIAKGVDRKTAKGLATKEAGKAKTLDEISKGVGRKSVEDTGLGSASDADWQGLVGGVGSAVAAVSGFTVAFSSFDVDQPLTSLMSLGFAAAQAKEAMGMLGPALKSFGIEMGGDSAVGKAMDMFGKEIDGIKGAPKKFASSLKGGTKAFKTSLAGGSGKMKALRAGLSATKGSLLKVFNVNSMKSLIGKGMTGIPGIVTSLIAGPIVGAISGAISSAAFGEKQTIEGTNIEGFKGTGAGGGAVAGGLEAAGGAVGSGLAAAATAAMIPGLATLSSCYWISCWQDLSFSQGAIERRC